VSDASERETALVSMRECRNHADALRVEEGLRTAGLAA